MNIQPNIKNVQSHLNPKKFAFNYLSTNFFISIFPVMVFEQTYFKYFTLKHYFHNTKLTEYNSALEKLYFIIKGSIKYEFLGSVISIHNTIKFIINGIKRRNYGRIDKQIEKMEKEYLNDPEIFLLKNKDDYIKTEFNKIQPLELFILNDGEIIGVEEFYINIPYLTNCYVTSEQVEVFEITENDFTSFLKNETALRTKFEEMALKKIISFIERLHNIKRKLIKMILFKNNKFVQTVFTNFPRQNTFTIQKDMKNNSFRNKTKHISLSQDIDFNNNISTLNLIDNISQTNTTFKNYLSNSLLAQSRRSTISKDFCLSKNTSEQFLNTQLIKQRTVVKLKNEHVTLENLENKIHQINQEYLLFQKVPNKLNKSHKVFNLSNDITIFPNHCASSSHLSFVNLSNVKDSLSSIGNNIYSNDSRSKDLPEMKTSFNLTTHSKIFKSQWTQKNKEITQDDINMKIHNDFLEHFILNHNIKYNSIVQHIKKFYNQKKIKGYCSLVNLENNKFRNTSIKKSNNFFKRNFLKKLKISPIEPLVQKPIRSISHDI